MRPAWGVVETMPPTRTTPAAAMAPTRTRRGGDKRSSASRAARATTSATPTNRNSDARTPVSHAAGTKRKPSVPTYATLAHPKTSTIGWSR